MRERLLEVLLAKRQLADSPDLSVGLESLLLLGLESSCLHGNDGRCSIGVMGNR